jgi:hypothetical protein
MHNYYTPITTMGQQGSETELILSNQNRGRKDSHDEPGGCPSICQEQSPTSTLFLPLALA